MKVELRFRSYAPGQSAEVIDLTVIIEGPPDVVDPITKSIRETVKLYGGGKEK